MLPANGFKIELGTPDTPAIRSFTGRVFELTARTLYFDVHDDGIVSTSARDVDAGTHVRFVGVRRDFAVASTSTAMNWSDAETSPHRRSPSDGADIDPETTCRLTRENAPPVSPRISRHHSSAPQERK